MYGFSGRGTVHHVMPNWLWFNMIHLWISQTNCIKRNQNFSTRCLSAWQRAPITPSNSCRQWAVSGGMSLDRSASFCLFLSVPRSQRRIPQFKFFVKNSFNENTNIQLYFRNTFPCPMIRKPKTTVTSLELFIFYMMQLSTQTHLISHEDGLQCFHILFVLQVYHSDHL